MWDRDAQRAGLPPSTVHCGHHGAATYTNAVGGSLLAIKFKLGHSTVAFTGDVYTSLLEEIDLDLAERTAALIPRNNQNINSGESAWSHGP